MTKPILVAVFVACGILGAKDRADASVQRVCVRYLIQTNDSALASESPREDHFLNGDVGIVVPAYGAYINVSINGQPVTGNVKTEPSTGCKTFWSPVDGTFIVRVYARSEDKKGNNVRIHNAGPSSFSSYPGQTYSLVTAYSSPSSSTRYITVGSAAPRWTMMATASFVLKQFNDGNSDKTIHIAEDTTSSCSNSSWFGASNDFLDEDRAYIRVRANSGSCTSESRPTKFLVAHEMGHALLRLQAGNKEGPWSATFPYSQMAGSVGLCTNDSGYHQWSVEWGSVGFKEGSADFVSARVFNNRASSGRYIRSGRETDLERAPVHAAGGRLVNTCNVDSTNNWGLGIREDWLRFWWDWYTDNTCSPTGSKRKMMDIFATTVNDHQDGTNTYFDHTAYGAVRDAADAQGFESCLEDRFRFYACFNGIDRQAGYADSSCY